METKINVKVDIQDVFDSLEPQEKETFVNANINYASEDVIIDYLKFYNGIDTIIEKISE